MQKAFSAPKHWSHGSSNDPRPKMSKSKEQTSNQGPQRSQVRTTVELGNKKIAGVCTPTMKSKRLSRSRKDLQTIPCGGCETSRCEKSLVCGFLGLGRQIEDLALGAMA